MSTTGKFLQCRIGASAGTALKGVKKWEVQERGDALDATDSDSGGFEDTDIGVTGLELTVEGVYDVAVDGAFPAIQLGTILVNVKAFGKADNTNPDYILPSAIVVSGGRVAEVKGQTTFKFTARSKGTFTANTTLA